MLIVKKFGGSSVADKERIFNVARRCIKDYQAGHDVVVVLSAMGKQTDVLIDMAKERCEKEKAEILRECDERYARAETHPYRGLYENDFTSGIICAALEDGQEIPNWLFVKACRLFDKHKENEDTLWKSYRFKGFVRWNQIEKAMKYGEYSNSRSKND